MNETVKHETLDTDPSTGVVNDLEQLDLAVMSFTQLKRLHSALKKTAGAIEHESARRANEDNSGDTVRIPSPKV